jgi:hypothetical protein
MRLTACEREEPSRLVRMAARAFHNASLLGYIGLGSCDFAVRTFSY